MLGFTYKPFFAAFHYAECSYAEFIMLSVVAPFLGIDEICTSFIWF
jgi:hypothetical protein